MATAPSSLFDYQSILDAAYTKLGQVTADADKAEEAQRQAYNKALAQSAVDRVKGGTKSRERDSARGLLDSGIALQDQADVSQAYDQQNAGYLSSYTNNLDQISRQRLQAQNDYTDAQNNFENYKLLGLDQNSPGITNPDPYNWSKIASDIAANPSLAPTPVKSITAKKPTIPKPIVKPVVPTPVKQPVIPVKGNY